MADSTETASDTSHAAKRSDRATYSIREAESVTEAVVRAVSAEKGCHPLEIEPLYSVIETDALDTLFAPRMSGARGTANKTLTFRYCGCEVRVTDNRQVIVKKSGRK